MKCNYTYNCKNESEIYYTGTVEGRKSLYSFCTDCNFKYKFKYKDFIMNVYNEIKLSKEQFLKMKILL